MKIGKIRGISENNEIQNGREAFLIISLNIILNELSGIFKRVISEMVHFIENGSNSRKDRKIYEKKLNKIIQNKKNIFDNILSSNFKSTGDFDKITVIIQNGLRPLENIVAIDNIIKEFLLTSEELKNTYQLLFLLGENKEETVELGKPQIELFISSYSKMVSFVLFYLDKLSKQKEKQNIDGIISSLFLEGNPEEIKRLKKIIEKLKDQLKNISFEKEVISTQNDELRKINIANKVDLDSLQSKINDLERMLNSIQKSSNTLEKVDLGSEFTELEEQNSLLGSENSELSSKNKELQNQVLLLEARVKKLTDKLTCVNPTNISDFLNGIEANLDNASIDDLLMYILYSNCPLIYKQKAIEVLVDYIELFIKSVSKGRSSSTNGNNGHAGGKYANNFINPFFNFIKGKIRDYDTQSGLEFLTSLNLAELIKEYKPDRYYSSKKDRVFENVLKYAESDTNYYSLGDFIRKIGELLQELNIGNDDLSVLSENIFGFLDNGDGTKRSLKKIAEDILSVK